MKKKSYLLISLTLVGAILFGIVSFVVIRSTRTVSAVVLNQEIKLSDRIDASMLKTIQVPVGTPEGFITDESSLVGQKLRVIPEPNQLIYMSDVITSWDDVVYGVSVPEDYIITALNIPNDRAVGGLITAGDTVDIFGVTQTVNSDGSGDIDTQLALGPIADHKYGAEGINVYPLLVNVKILETNSTLSNEDNGIFSTITDESSGQDGAYYIVALSYNDYQKILLSQKYLDLWMNMAPAWNNENAPLLDVMEYSEIQGLMDAQAQSIIDEVKDEVNDQITHKINQDALDEIQKKKQEWIDKNKHKYVQPSFPQNQNKSSDSVQNQEETDDQNSNLENGYDQQDGQEN